VLIKRTDRQARRSSLVALTAQSTTLDRRAFLRRSGIGAGSLAVLGTMPLGTVRKADAAVAGPLSAGAVIRKSICTHCSVGCTVTAEVANGVWIGQEPSWDSPINRGSHCAKGASVRELVSGERRLKYPMKLVNGQWTRVSWAPICFESSEPSGALIIQTTRRASVTQRPSPGWQIPGVTVQ